MTDFSRYGSNFLISKLPKINRLPSIDIKQISSKWKTFQLYAKIHFEASSFSGGFHFTASFWHWTAGNCEDETTVSATIRAVWNGLSNGECLGNCRKYQMFISIITMTGCVVCRLNWLHGLIVWASTSTSFARHKRWIEIGFDVCVWRHRPLDDFEKKFRLELMTTSMPMNVNPKLELRLDDTRLTCVHYIFTFKHRFISFMREKLARFDESSFLQVLFMVNRTLWNASDEQRSHVLPRLHQRTAPDVDWSV